MVADVGRRAYLAKDARISTTPFQQLFPQWREREAARNLYSARSYREGHHQRYRQDTRCRLSAGLLALDHVDHHASARGKFQAAKVPTTFLLKLDFIGAERYKVPLSTLPFIQCYPAHSSRFANMLLGKN